MSMKETADGQRDSNGRFLPGNNSAWKPGQSGNPKGGPPKEFSVTAKAQAILERDVKRLQRIAEMWITQAEEGKTEARRDLQDRMEGKVPLQTELSTKEPIEHVHTVRIVDT